LEGTLKIIWFQPPCYEQGHLPLDQVARAPVASALQKKEAAAEEIKLSKPRRKLWCLLSSREAAFQTVPVGM